MVHPTLARVKSLRQVKKFNLCWQFFVSRTYSRLRKCYMDADARLVLSYPPGCLLHKSRKRNSQAKFRLRPDFPRELELRGLCGSPRLKMKRKLMLRRQARTTTVQHGQSGVKPKLTEVKCNDALETDFLYVDAPEFAVHMFEKYKFNKLLSFVVDEISSDQTPLWEFSYYGEEWIGIRLADLRNIAEKYPPISEVESKSKLTFRLIPSKAAQHQFFLFGVYVGVTKDGRLKRGGPNISVSKKVKEIPTPDSIVLLWNQLQY